MKALIFASGMGKRMGEFTKSNPKCMVKLLNGESLFERQIRILYDCGIRQFIVTTGSFEEQLKEIASKPSYRDASFIFVHNEIYNETNNIYSAYLAKELIDDDFLMLHCDLVFCKRLVSDIIANSAKSLCVVNRSLPLPDKDFKCRIKEGKLVEVSVDIFDDGCYALQPFYKLSKDDIAVWFDSIIDFVENRQITDVYAENAFNAISDRLTIAEFSYDGYYINEIDNAEDYRQVSHDIELVDYREQEIYYSIESLYNLITKYKFRKPLIVCDEFLRESEAIVKICAITNPIIFSDFKPNPIYEDVCTAVNLFKERECDSLISIGGGSAIDTAKAVKIFLPLDENKPYLEQSHRYINLKHIAVPTTAGTGSESTRFAVVYYNGVKQSITDDNILPDIAVLEPDFLETLPYNQKASTVLDALCQAIESMWSVNSTDESRGYAENAIILILSNLESYMQNSTESSKAVMKAANFAGKAINISQTTAAHSLSYKLTSMYNIPHGQAVAMCLPNLWKMLSERCDKTIDKRGVIHVKNILRKIDNLFDAETDGKAISKFINIVERLGVLIDINISEEDKITLVNSVNRIRLENFPLKLDFGDIYYVYSNLCGMC